MTLEDIDFDDYDDADDYDDCLDIIDARGMIPGSVMEAEATIVDTYVVSDIDVQYTGLDHGSEVYKHNENINDYFVEE